MIKLKRKNPTQNTKNNPHSTQQITTGTWVYETSAPLTPMCVGKMLGFGMCEVIYGKGKPFRTYKRRIETLRLLTPQEIHQVNNAMCNEVRQAAMKSA